MTLVILIVLLVFAIGVASVRNRAPGQQGAPLFLPPPDAHEAEDESPSELSLRDPVEALRRYGTPADAARLAEQGNDLSALGYRPPDRD